MKIYNKNNFSLDCFLPAWHCDADCKHLERLRYQGKPDHGFMSVLRDWDSNPQFIRRSVP